MKIFLPATAVLTVMLCGISVAAAEQQLVYEGRISVGGKDFDGVGLFRFALVGATGNLVWASSAQAKSSGIPETAIKIPVKNGVYSVTLGDPQLGMLPLGPALSAEANGLKLRIWFDDGKHGVAQIEPDQPIVLVAPQPEAQPSVKQPSAYAPPSAAPPTTAVRPAAAAITSDQASEILNELRQIRNLLARQAANAPAHAQPAAAQQPPQPVNVKLPLKGNFTIGSADAPITMVEFTDYQCPFCKRFHTETFPELKKKYIDTGKVLFVSRNLPLQFHQYAPKAAQAALCAGEQNKYWEMRDAMFANQAALKPEDLTKYAGDVGLDVEKFSACFNSEKFQDAIKADETDAASAGITATPSFVLGRTAKDVLDGVKIVGTRPSADFDKEFAKLLDLPKPAEPAPQPKPDTPAPQPKPDAAPQAPQQ